MIPAFTRRVEAAVVNWTESKNRGLIDWEPGENSIRDDEYAIIAVPSDLVGRIVVIMVLDRDGKPLDVRKQISESNLARSPSHIMQRALKMITSMGKDDSGSDEAHPNTVDCGQCGEIIGVARRALEKIKECI